MSRRPPNGKWEAVWRIPGSDVKWRQKTKTFLYKRDADAHEDTMKAEVVGNVYVEPTKDTSAVFLHHWLDNTLPDVAESTQITYQRYIDNYIVPHLGVSEVQNLKPAHIAWFLNTMLSSYG